MNAVSPSCPLCRVVQLQSGFGVHTWPSALAYNSRKNGATM